MDMRVGPIGPCIQVCNFLPPLVMFKVDLVFYPFGHEDIFTVLIFLLAHE